MTPNKYISSKKEKLAFCITIMGLVLLLFNFFYLIEIIESLAFMLVGGSFIFTYYTNTLERKLTLHWYIDVAGFYFLSLGLTVFLPDNIRLICDYLLFPIIVGIVLMIKWKHINRKYGNNRLSRRDYFNLN